MNRMNNHSDYLDDIVDGFSIQTAGGLVVTVEGPKIGSGGQGTVWKVKGDDDKLYAMKVYNPDTARDDSFFDRVKQLCQQEPVSNYFIWPIDYFDDRHYRGYIMDYLYDYKPVSFLINEKVSNRIIGEVAEKIVSGIHFLHNNGLCFCDINQDDILVNIDSMDVRYCDCDNIAVSGTKSNIKGKEGFIAPEIIAKGAPPTKETDLHAIAVLLFKMMVRSHPFEGLKTRGFHDEMEKKKIYGTNPIFIFDLDDTTNPPVNDDIDDNWDKLPEALNELFNRAFIDGIRNPKERPSSFDWLKAIDIYNNSNQSIGTEVAAAPKKILNFYVIVDVSGSMRVDGRIDSVNEMIRWIVENIPSVVDSGAIPKINVMTFGSKAEWLFEEDLEMNKYPTNHIIYAEEGNWTIFNEAFSGLLAKMPYKGKAKESLLTPIIIMISDGKPSIKIDGSLDKLLENITFKNSIRIAFRLDSRCDTEIMTRFSCGPCFVIDTYSMDLFKETMKVVTMTSSKIASNPAGMESNTGGLNGQQERVRVVLLPYASGREPSDNFGRGNGAFER